MKNRYRSIIDVHVILVREGNVLLALREGTGYCDGMWHLPSGHLEAGESIEQGAIREAEEEIGVRIDPEDLRFVHLMHHRNPGEEPRVGVFFEVTRWWGEPTIREPHKCGKLGWFPLDMLPDDLIAYPAAALRAYTAGRTFSLHGW